MNMGLLCVLLGLSINIFLICILVAIIIYGRNLAKQNQLKQLELNFKFKPEEDDFKLIETLIQDNLAEYRIYKLENIEKLYINEEKQKKMFEYILRKTMYQLSPIYIQKLSYIYNKDRLDELIVQKINLAIMGYTVEVNSNYRK